MSASLKTASLLAALFLLTGCAPKQSELPPAAAPFASAAITLKLNARPDLNLVNGLANSCTLLLLQGTDEASLKKTLASPAALKAFFAGTGADGEASGAVLAVDRYVMMPGQSTVLHIDRVMDARYVALVAGYYPFPSDRQMRIVAVPVEQFSRGWWRPERRQRLKPLVLSAVFGARGFVDIKNASGEDLHPTGTEEDTEQ